MALLVSKIKFRIIDKAAVETTAGELGGVLATLKKAVEAGELDAQIEAVSVVVRKGFKK